MNGVCSTAHKEAFDDRGGTGLLRGAAQTMDGCLNYNMAIDSREYPP
jgi:hypothetical protein